MTGLLLGHPASDAASLGLAGLVASEPVEETSIVVLVANSVEDVLEKARGAFEPVADGGRLWIAYRKGAKPLHRDTLQDALHQVGLDGVTLIALNDEWSAMRVRAL